MKLAFSIAELAITWILIPILLFAGAPFSAALGMRIFGTVIIAGSLFLSIYSALILYYWSGRLPTFFFGPETTVQSGPYRFVRHPFNAGFIAFIFGLGILCGDYWRLLYVVVVTAAVVLYSLFQERLAIKRIDSYKEYKERIPFMIPDPQRRISFDKSRSIPWQFIVASFVVKLAILFVLPSRVKNSKVLRQKRPFVIAMAHQTHFDGPLIFYSTWRYIRFVGTAIYVDRLGLLGWLSVIPVRRYAVDTSAIRQMLATIKQGVPLGIAPEAARSWDGRPLHTKREIWKLFRMLKIPIIPVKFFGVQRLWPRWSKIFSVGTSTIEFGNPVEADDPQLEEKVMDFLGKEDSTFKLPYRNYKHIEKLIWRCPSCGTISSIKGFRSGFSCSSCGKSWTKPTVNEVIQIHDKIMPGSMGLSFPIKDDVIYNGKKVVATMYEDHATIGDYRLDYNLIKNSSIEKSIEPVFGIANEMVSFVSTTSALKWQEVVDFQIKFRLKKENYHTELWG
jgi:1-acyl-sn-glycerol-3-phosphate acyltransferase/protein-S-isoprenylcysteine O-methyltransferase Ste14